MKQAIPQTGKMFLKQEIVTHIRKDDDLMLELAKIYPIRVSSLKRLIKNGDPKLLRIDALELIKTRLKKRSINQLTEIIPIPAKKVRAGKKGDKKQLVTTNILTKREKLYAE